MKPFAGGMLWKANLAIHIALYERVAAAYNAQH
jgi:hypothetical protein